MTAPNEVKLKVRHYALLLEEFTVAQIVELTGLKSASVRTEVQRMRREKLVVPSRQESKGRGGPPCIYMLTDDPEARLALSKSIEAFYLEATPHPPRPRQPASRHFFQAAEIIQALIDQSIAPDQSDAAIREAAYHLEFARHEEGVGREGTEIIRAHLDREKAKLEVARGNLVEAEELIQRSVEAFRSASLQDEADRANRDWIIASLRYQVGSAKVGENLNGVSMVDLLQRLRESVCRGVAAQDPLARLIRDIFDLLIEKEHQEQPKNLVLVSMRELRQMACETAGETAQEIVREIRSVLELRYDRVGADLAIRKESERLGYRPLALGSIKGNYSAIASF